MSTNYYVEIDGEEIHLGKYAVGHPFMFRGHPDRSVADYEAWRAMAATGQIRTEAGTEITLGDLVETAAEATAVWGRRQRFTPYPNQHDDGRGHRFTNAEFC
jgi:hypothetical protein